MVEPVSCSRHDSLEEDEEKDEKDILLRQSRLLYPEVEEWILEIEVSTYLKQNQLNPDVNFRSLNINEECECGS
jgi:hypothetical protein